MIKFKEMYINGNYVVTSNEYGKSRSFCTLRLGEDFQPDFPDSIDLKITNKCSHGCTYCHESSTLTGRSFDLEETKKILDGLPNKGIEIAIGGGNILECYDEFESLLDFCREKNFYTRATINVRDFLKSQENLEKIDTLVRSNRLGALGISIENYSQVKELKDSFNLSPDFYISCVGSGRSVFHIIIGVFPISDLINLVKQCSLNGNGVLILGFKSFGRGSGKTVDKDIIFSWREELSRILMDFRFKINQEFSLGFDNLAIDQLELRDLVLKSEWDKFYLGRDFSHTMYVDAVNKTYAPTSRSPFNERTSWSDVESIVEYFRNNHNKWS